MTSSGEALPERELEAARAESGPWTAKRIVLRGALLLVAGTSIYLLAPTLIEVFSSWPSLKTLQPEWLGAMVAFEIASFFAFWELQRIAVQTRQWFSIVTSQVAANAFGRVIPGGAATAGALQYRMLTTAGLPPNRVASGVTVVTALMFATLLALPLVAIPAMAGGAPVDRSLVQAAWAGAVVFVLMVGVGAALFLWNRPLELVGRAIQWLLNRIPRRSRTEGLPNRLLVERDRIKRALGPSWWKAVIASVAKWAFDYAALLAALLAIGADPNPSLVLLAYVVAQLLGMIPFTPGGLGFVEAGLTGTLVLAGIDAKDAALATLAYRLVAFWAPIPLGAVAYGAFRFRYRGEREPAVEATLVSAAPGAAPSGPFSLAVVAYEGRDTAERVYEELQTLQKEGALSLRDAAVIERSDGGRVKLRQKHGLTAGTGALGGSTIGVLVGVVLGTVVAPAAIGAAIGAAAGVIDTGIKDKLMKQLGEELGPDDSALAVLIEKANWPVVEERTAPYGGRVLLAELTNEAVAGLEQAAGETRGADDESA